MELQRHESGCKCDKARNLDRLITAVAERGHSAALLQAIEERERQLEGIRNAARSSESQKRQVRPEEVTEFVMSRLTRLPQLLNVDVAQARAELLRHVTEIRLVPQQTGEGADYVAEGEWDLLGNREEMDRARLLPGVRARLVAGVGFEPTTSGFRNSLVWGELPKLTLAMNRIGARELRLRAALSGQAYFDEEFGIKMRI